MADDGTSSAASYTDRGPSSVQITLAATSVCEFQKGAVPIFLISLKAGGTGLNLTAADIELLLAGPWAGQAPSLAPPAATQCRHIQAMIAGILSSLAKKTVGAA